jgi:hypothetical protein
MAKLSSLFRLANLMDSNFVFHYFVVVSATSPIGSCVYIVCFSNKVFLYLITSFLLLAQVKQL